MDPEKAKKIAEKHFNQEIDGWKVGKYINSGKSALVCSATKGGNEYAIKIHDSEVIERSGESETAVRIDRQLELIDKSHENLIKIYGGGFCKKTQLFYIVMELINESNLCDVITQVPREKIGSLISQVAAAAQFLEKLNLVHRDIKPENIIVTNNFDKAILLDLGVVRPMGITGPTDSTNTQRFIGTLRYGSREYLLREEEDSKKGWRALTFYQLGAVLHDMIMGYPLFQEQSEPYTRLVQAVCHETPRICAADINPEIVLLAKNCLLKKPDLRVKLVNWEDFKFSGKNLQDLEVVKQRIRKRQKRNQEISSCSVKSGSDERKRNIAQKMYDIGCSLDAIIRGICVGNAVFPPQEIDKIDEQDEVSVFIRFAGSEEHSLKKNLTIVVKLCLLDFDSSVTQVQSTGVLSDKRYSGEPDIMTELFEGIFNEDIIKTRLDEAIHKLFDRGQGYSESESDCCDTDSAEQSCKLILLNLNEDDRA